MCLDAQGGIKAERQPFVVVGVWSCHCDFTALLLYAVSCSVSNDNS